MTLAVKEPVNWIEYNLDGEIIKEIEANSTLSGLSLGLHNMTVYGTDAAGNVGVSTIFFTISEPFPVVPVVAVSGALIMITVSIGFLVYLKKHKGKDA